jgi:hypothetical protein
MTNPITDTLAFLTANTGDFNALGLWKYLILLLFYALLAGSLWLAAVNWRGDPARRTGTALWLWFARQRDREAELGEMTRGLTTSKFGRITSVTKARCASKVARPAICWVQYQRPF